MKYFVLLMFFFLISCSENTKKQTDCTILPDFERIAKELEEYGKGMDEIHYNDMMSAKARCNF